MVAQETRPAEVALSAKAASAVRLADLLRTEILDGGFPIGSPLPAEFDLRVTTRSGRNVVRAALDLLRREGFVRRRPGLGTVVSSERVRLPVDRPVGIASSFVGGGHRVVTRFRTVTKQTAVGPIAQRLDLAEGAACVLVEYETAVDRRPYALAASYFDAERFGLTFDTDLAGDWFGDWYAVLERLGFQPGKLLLRMESTQADALTAGVLGVEEGDPIFRFERLLHGTDGRPLDFGFSRCRADRVVLDLELGGSDRHVCGPH